MRRHPGVALWLIGCLAALCRAAERPPADLVGDLERLGYENIALESDDSTLSVWCENRRVRYPPAWMVEALVLAAERVPPETRVRLVAEKLARPIVSLSARAGDVREWIDGRMPSSEFRRRLTIRFAGSASPPERRNASVRRFDLVLGPGRMLSQFGLPGSYVRLHVDVGAELVTALRPGLAAYGRAFIPIGNRGGAVGGDSRYYELRPGSMLVSYGRAFGSSAFSTLTAGMFELGNRLYDSYGLSLDARKYSPGGHWSVGGQVSYVGFAAYTIDDDLVGRRRIWRFSWPPARWPYQAVASYRVDGVDLQIVGRWGRFLGGDRGWRVDIARKFGELGVTIFGIGSDGRFAGASRVDPKDTKLLGGVQFELPLYPGSRGMPDRFRVTSASSFTWAYRYRIGNVGVDVATKYQVEDLIAQYNPVVIGNNLDRVRVWVRRAGVQAEHARGGMEASASGGH